MLGLLGSIGGSLISGISSIFGANSTNQANKDMVAQQEAFQQQMSNTAYTRASADMKNAGLNPMMMFGSGGAASTPSGAIAPMQSGIGEAGHRVGQTATKALDALVTNKTLEKMTDEIANLKATNAKISADTAVSRATEPLVREKTRGTAAEADISTAGIAPAALKKQLAIKAIDLYNTGWGDTAYKGSLLGKNVSDAISPLGDLVNSATKMRNRYHDGAFP